MQQMVAQGNRSLLAAWYGAPEARSLSVRSAPGYKLEDTAQGISGRIILEYLSRGIKANRVRCVIRESKPAPKSSSNNN